MVATKLIAVLLVAVVAVGGVSACIVIGNDDDKGPDVPDVPDTPDPTPDTPDPKPDPSGPTDPDTPDVPGPYDPSTGSATDWSQWLGGFDSPGVSDTKSPIAKEDMKEVWKVVGKASGSMSSWYTPGSAICVGQYTYYYSSLDFSLHRVVTATGEDAGSVGCPTRLMYNTALAYGDDKIFVPTFQDASTVVVAYDAETLEKLFVTEPVYGGQVQGPISYKDGRIFFGTYAGDYACFSSEDPDPKSSDEVSPLLWSVEGKGWYNASPAFLGDLCVIVEKGYDKNGAIAYLVETSTGAIVDTMEFYREYCVSAATAYEGRVYIALNAVSDKTLEEVSDQTPKTLTIHSFEIDGGFVDSSEKVWRSTAKGGGTQSIPVIWNDRLYIGGGGSVMGSNEPFHVIDILSDGTMRSAYSVDIKTKSTPTLTIGYSGAVYIYVIEYGHVFEGEDEESTNGTADVVCLRDRPGQKSGDVVFRVTPSVPQFAYQSIAISSDGYILVRNDSTLFCYGPGKVDPAKDLIDEIESAIDRANSKKATPADAPRIEERYASLTDDGKAAVSDAYGRFTALYRTVTFDYGTERVEARILKGCTVALPEASPDGRIISGWTCDGKSWDFTDRVSGDMVLDAVYASVATVTLDPSNGSAKSSVAVVKGGIMGFVSDPVREGYTFGGWFSGDTEYTPQYSRVDSDIALTARWLKNSTISFDSDGGSSASSMEAVYGKPVGKLPTVKKSGSSFLGWFYGDERYTEDTIYLLEQSIVLKAHWDVNKEGSVEAGKGVSVKGALPADAEADIIHKKNVETTSTKSIREAAGNENVDIFMLSLSGDGIDGTQRFTLVIDMDSSMNGRQVNAYFYMGSTSKVLKVEGTVADGKLEFEFNGITSSKGVQVDFGLTAGTGLAERFVIA